MWYSKLRRAYEVRRVRRAVTEKFIIIRFITNYSKHLYASRDMTVT